MRARHPALFVGMLVIGGAGCASDLSGFECVADSSCRSGQRCVDRGCASGDTSCPAGLRWDSTAGDRAGSCAVTPTGDLGVGDLLCPGGLCVVDLASAEAACTKTTCIHDDFNDGVAAAFWSENFANGAEVVEQGGVLAVLLPQTNSTGQPFAAGYRTGMGLDLTSSSISVSVRETTSTMSSAFTSLSAVSALDSKALLSISEATGILTARVQNSSAAPVDMVVPFDSTNAKVWRIREAGGIVFFEISDGLSWSVIGTVATPVFATSVKVEIAAGWNSPDANRPGMAIFDDFNLPPMPGG